MPGLRECIRRLASLFTGKRTRGDCVSRTLERSWNWAAFCDGEGEWSRFALAQWGSCHSSSLASCFTESFLPSTPTSSLFIARLEYPHISYLFLTDLCYSISRISTHPCASLIDLARPLVIDISVSVYPPSTPITKPRIYTSTSPLRQFTFHLTAPRG